MIRSNEPHHPFMPRLNNLTDGIFAIAMTILVLTIDSPQLPPETTSAALWNALVDKLHPFLNYFLSFYILAGIWLSQVHQARHMAHTKRRYIWLELLAMMLVCLVPFTTNLSGDYPDLTSAKLALHLNLFLVGSAYALEGALVRRDEILLSQCATPQELRFTSRMSLLLPVAALAGLFMCPFWPSWSSMPYLALPLLHPFLWRKHMDGANGDEPVEIR